MKKNNYRLQQNRKQQGIGLLELMLALAIIAILLVMATRYYMSASLNSRVNQTADAVNSLPAAGECWVSSSANTGTNAGTYVGLDTHLGTISFTDHCYPTSLVTAATGGLLVTPYGNLSVTATATTIKVTIPATGVTVPNTEIQLLANKICQRGFASASTSKIVYEAISQTCSSS